MEITGKIIQVLEKRSGTSSRSGNAWASQDYVLEFVDGNSQFPRHMVFNVFGEDRISQMNIQVGQTLTVSFDVDAHEYQGRWFNNIRAWRVVAASENAVPPVVDAAPNTVPSCTAVFVVPAATVQLPFLTSSFVTVPSGIVISALLAPFEIVIGTFVA